MIQSELDRPANISSYPCKLCGVPLKDVKWHWVFDRWLHATVHVKCADAWENTNRNSKQKEVDPDEGTPERYRDFNPSKFPHKVAMAKACLFNPDAEHKIFVLSGLAGRGKSRLMWAVIKGFFDDLRERTGRQYWVDHVLWTDAVSDWSRDLVTRMKQSRYLYLADCGSTDAGGRERASVQQVVRTRIAKGQWTFLEVDDFDLFDTGLSDLLTGRSVQVFIEE